MQTEEDDGYLLTFVHDITKASCCRIDWHLLPCMNVNFMRKQVSASAAAPPTHHCTAAQRQLGDVDHGRADHGCRAAGGGQPARSRAFWLPRHLRVRRGYCKVRVVSCLSLGVDHAFSAMLSSPCFLVIAGLPSTSPVCTAFSVCVLASRSADNAHEQHPRPGSVSLLSLPPVCPAAAVGSRPVLNAVRSVLRAVL